MPEQAIVNYLEEHRERDVAAIQELVRQPSVSTEKLGVADYARLLRDHYQSIGCTEAHVVDVGDDVPGVWAYLESGAAHTIASYAYFDTYGVDERAWEHPPYGGTRAAYGGFPDVVIGRGATVKGSHRAWMGALQAMHDVNGALPVNVLFMSEGAEMLGSPNFDAICDAAGAHLGKVEAFLNPRIAERPGSDEIPVVLGYKNMVTFDLVCRANHWGRGPVAGTVYGNSKSVVDAPTHRLVQALATMIGPDGNRIAIDGLTQLNDERVQLSDEEQALVDALDERFSGGAWNAALPTAGGVERWVDDRDGKDLLLAYLYGPSINVSAIRSAGVGDVPQLTMLLPDSATASLELRMVTEMSAGEVIDCVRGHLAARDFPEVEVVPWGLWDGQRISTETAIVQGALRTFKAYGRTPVIWPIQPFGGPWAGAAQRLGVPSLSGCALGYGANGGGSANEYFVIDGGGAVTGLVAAEAYLVDLVSNVAERLSGRSAAAAANG